MNNRSYIFTITFCCLLLCTISKAHGQNSSSKNSNAIEKELTEITRQYLEHFIRGNEKAFVNAHAKNYVVLNNGNIRNHKQFKKVYRTYKQSEAFKEFKEAKVRDVFVIEKTKVLDYAMIVDKLGSKELGFNLQEGDYFVYVPSNKISAWTGFYRKVRGKWKVIAGD